MAEKSKVLALAQKILEDHQEVGSVNAITKIFDIPYAKVKLPNGRCRGAVDLSEGVEIWWPQIDPLRPNSGWVNVARTNADGEIVEIEESHVEATKNIEHMQNIRLKPNTRITFGKFDLWGRYKYLGIFDFDPKRSVKSCVWVKVADDCYLNDACSGNGNA